MHGRNVTIIFLQKEDKHRVRLTVGGNIIDYPGNVSTPTVDLITAKILFNSVVSTPNSRFMCTDDKDYHLTRQWNAMNIRDCPLP